MPMLDPETGSSLVTILKPDGTSQHLKKCSPSDWMRLANTFRHTRKAWKIVSMTGQPQELVQTALDELDRQRIFYDDVVNFLLTWEGQYEAILLSLAKDSVGATRQQVEAAFDALGLQPGEWLKPAAALFNVKLVPIEVAKKNEANDPADGATMSPTTDVMPTSSETPSIAPITP